MTPQACEIQRAMHNLEKLEKHDVERISKKIKKSWKTIIKLFKEIIYEDKLIFDRLFLSSYTPSVRHQILCMYLNVSPDKFKMSPMLNELEKLSIYMMTCETLSSIYRTITEFYNLTMNEFIISWYMLNETDELRQMFFAVTLDPEILNDTTKKVYIKERESMQAEMDYMLSKRKEVNE